MNDALNRQKISYGYYAQTYQTLRLNFSRKDEFQEKYTRIMPLDASFGG